MEEQTIIDDDGKGFTKVFSGKDIELVNPIDYYADWEIRKSISLERAMLNQKNPIITAFISDEFFEKRAKQKWEERLAQIQANKVPNSFITLLNSASKNEQEKLIRGQSISPLQLAAYIFRAWTEFGFSFSSYRAEHNHKGLNEDDLPEMIHIEGDKVVTAGETKLTEGQLKNVVNYRTVTISKFLDREDVWHCFFITYNSIGGKENWKGGQPHYHYISDKWGYSRKEAVEKLKSTKYPATSIHIPLINYREP